jgi:hypothetical protein
MAVGVGENVGTNVGEAIAITVGVAVDGKDTVSGPCPAQSAIINNKVIT